MSDKLDRVCDQLRIKLDGIDRRLEALKGNAMALSSHLRADSRRRHSPK